MDSLRFFEEKYGLTALLLERVLSQALWRGGSFAEIFLEHRIFESLQLEEGVVKNPTISVSQGAGVRVLCGERTGYAHTAEMTEKELIAAADAAAYISDRSAAASVCLAEPDRRRSNVYDLGAPVVSAPLEEKIRLLVRADEAARAHDPRVREARASISSLLAQTAVLNSEGLCAVDARPLIRFGVSVIAQDGPALQKGQKGGGGRVGLEFFRAHPPESFAVEAARQAVLALTAAPAPSGEMDVVLGPGWPGILLHEAVGHGLEADFIRKGTSVFTGLVGTRVASPLCTVMDDGARFGLRGSLNIDDEGTRSGATLLIEKGILRGFLHDRLSAGIMGTAPTGNGRRESYQHAPLPRMTNTYLVAGDQDPASIVASVARGLYAPDFGGGQVDITSGKFVFSASEAYLIEDGRITCPVQGATLIGNGPDILTRIQAVGNDLRFDQGLGTCGKDGQYVPVGVGMPTVCISNMTVGGTALRRR